MKKLLLLFALALCLDAAPARATTDAAEELDPAFQTGSWSAATAAKAKEAAKAPAGTAPVTSSNSIVVTSIETCLSQLDPADAAEIRAHYVKPYAECQFRLQEKLSRKEQQKTAKTEAPVADTPRNYLRVQQPPAPAPADEKSSAKPTASQKP